jgi:ligand-binding sensor domain-containing protein
LRYLKTILVLWACLLAHTAWSQRDIVLFENITSENGLAQNTITSIIHGQDHFMWIATAEGLHRYDGYEFLIFKHKSGDSSSLADDYITSMCESQDGNLLIGTYSGSFDLFDKKSRKFKHIELLDTNGNPNKYSINTIFPVGESQYLIGLDGGGIIHYEAKSNQQSSWHSKNSSVPNNYINCFARETGGNGIWVGTEQGIILYRAQTKVFKEFRSLDLFSNQNVTGIVQKNSTAYLTTKGQGLHIWHMANDSIEKIASPKHPYARMQQFILPDKDGSFWIGTHGGGLLKYKNGAFVSYKNDPYNKRSIVSDDIISATLDNTGNLWVGTIKGISKFDKSLNLFSLFRKFEHKGKATDNNVYCIVEGSDGHIWLGTKTGGLSKFDPKTEKLTVYPLIKSGHIVTKAVRAIHQDKNGLLWVGTRDEGLFSFDIESEKFTFHPTINHRRFNTIRHIFEDQFGMFWLGTRMGLVRFDPNTYKSELFESPSLNNNPIYQIYEDVSRNELILVTMRLGVHIFNRERSGFTVLTHDDDDTLSPNVNLMMCIEPMGNDSFMIGTYGGGINIFNRKTLEFSHLTTKNGLVNNVVYGILQEGDDFWLSTNQGLCRYNHSTGVFKSFGMEYYLQGLEYNEGAYCASSNGLFFFGGNNGFNYFRPQRLGLNLAPPTVVLTSFSLMDKEVQLEQDINFTEELNISFHENLISFSFAALNFSNSKENKYAYKLDGHDADWIESGSRRTAYYTKLAPGSYTFRVKASNNHGAWNELGKSIIITVTPPYWQTWWFIVILIALLLLTIWLILHLRTRAIAKNFEHQLVDLELKALRSQMNPHFIFNSLNSIQYFVLNKEPDEAYKYLTKFSQLMRMILQYSRVKYITLKEECEWLRTYLDLEKVRMDNDLNYEIDIHSYLVEEKVLIPSMMIQPYVENAIIHGLFNKEKDRTLKVSFKAKDEILLCTVEDNGIGRVESAILNKKKVNKHKSHGMKVTKDRIQALSNNSSVNPELKIEDLVDSEGNASGTRVTVSLPLRLDL